MKDTGVLGLELMKEFEGILARVAAAPRNSGVHPRRGNVSL
jgi:hypothetical protein